MTRPAAGSATALLYESLGPFTHGDEERGWPLLTFAEALCEANTNAIYDLVRDRPGYGPGWVVLFDPWECPAWALAYLAQYTGVVLAPSLTEQEQREAIALPANFKRGTPEAMRQAVKRTLTGSKTVSIVERLGGEAYQLWVRTRDDETPNESATLSAVLSQKPGGLVLTFETVAGWAWADVVAAETDWAEVMTDFPSWGELVAELP